MNKRLLLMVAAIFGLMRPGAAQNNEFRFQVRHDHDFKSCSGELIFTAERVRYETDHLPHAREWQYQDIQQVGLLGPTEISIVTFEDRKWIAGKDRRFHFKLIAGVVPDQLNRFLQGRLTRPLVTALVPQEQELAKFKVPAKHLHAWGGCQGVLNFSEEWLSYVSDTPGDSRLWWYEELDSVGSTGPFQLRITALERTRSEIGSQKNFIFDLKSRLTAEIYDFVWWKVNQSRIAQVP